VIAIGWRCLADPDVPFLTARSPAEWIVLPTPWTPGTIPAEERRVRFRTTFHLPAKPRSGLVRLRVFRDYTLWVNGTRIGGPADRTVSWKRIREHDVTAALRSGDNEIQAEVVHTSGPPALWLVMQADQMVVKTDGEWQARAGTGSWTSARLATEPAQYPIAKALPTTVEGWRGAWPVMLLWLGIGLGVTALGGWLSRRTAGEGDAKRDGPTPTPSADRAELALLGLVATLWVVLCANNTCRLPPVMGFDAEAHIEYVQFLTTKRILPLASDGWAMYHPPLYYLLSGGLVAVGRLLGWANAHAIAPRRISMVSGLALVVLVWRVLRIMFPRSRSVRCAGMLLAAAMPMNLYIAQFLSNEMMCAALVTAGLVLALRIIRDDATSWTRYAGLGAVLGLALLTKYTALLAIVVVLTVIAGAWVVGHWGRWRVALVHVGTILAIVLVVAGWVGVRNWIHFRNPFVANWDPAIRQSWWQDPGYRTSTYYLRFGRSLAEPFYSCRHSYADGIYATVWGDGLCAGVAADRFLPPWQYDLMAVGYVLALFPTALMVVGGVKALVGWLRRPTAGWALLLGYAVLTGVAVLSITLKLPHYSVVKGFYGLSALACICAFGAMGFGCVVRWLGRAGVVMWVPLLIWAVNAYASFVVWPTDARTHYRLGETFRVQSRLERSEAHYRQALREDPDLVVSYGGLGALLSKRRQHAEARQVLQDGLSRDPNDLDLQNSLAWLTATCPDPSIRDGHAALLLAERVCAATSHERTAYLNTLAAAQAETGRFTRAIQTLERAIALTGPADAALKAQYQVLLKRYRARRPYRQPAR